MRLFFLLSILLAQACNNKKPVDLLVFNATIYTVDSLFSTATAMVIKDGKIVATGNKADLQRRFSPTKELDAEGKFIYPGFIDAHAHFVAYAKGLNEVNLVNTNSWNEVLQACKVAAQKTANTSWLIGRGWDQNDWDIKQFPNNEELNKLFPDRPIYLTRIDGHAAIANAKALEIAGIQPGQRIEGGTYEMKNGRLTGILIDNAMLFIAAKIPQPTKEDLKILLHQAENNCFATGLTTIDDCGLDYDMVETISALQEEDALKMRLYIMLSDNRANIDYLKAKGKIKTNYLNVRAFKFYGDGALGSKGACLLQDYSDKPGWKGFMLSNLEHFDSGATIMATNGWQMCTHAIGDSSNRALLKIYAAHLKGKNDLRWRIEHAQVVNKNDFHFFGDFNIIPSVQPTHATSDMDWAIDRLGAVRLKDAYAYKRLLAQNGWISLGTDFPVEDISPFKTFYAAVVRKAIPTQGNFTGKFADGFQIEDALNREQTLRGITIWAARANFEEKEKGSLEPGKFADFTILDKDLMKIPESEILNTSVLKTFSNGLKVYEKK